MLAVDAAALTSGSPLLEECFGPVAPAAEYGSEAELASVLAALPGSLAAGAAAGGRGGSMTTAVTRCGHPCTYRCAGPPGGGQ